MSKAAILTGWAGTQEQIGKNTIITIFSHFGLLGQNIVLICQKGGHLLWIHTHKLCLQSVIHVHTHLHMSTNTKAKYCHKWTQICRYLSHTCRLWLDVLYIVRMYNLKFLFSQVTSYKTPVMQCCHMVHLR